MQERSQPRKALVVNSDPDVQRLLEEVLNECGYQVRDATNTWEASQLFKTEDFSLVIGELEFPGFDGMQILDLVQRLRSKAKVVLITSHVGAEIYLRVRARGAFDCISKSLEKSALREVIVATRN